jgi:hypothetical protein
MSVFFVARRAGPGGPARAEQNRKKEVDARDVGFPNPESHERAKQFARLSPTDQERILEEYKRGHGSDFPEH